jgi:hypothetical protein
MGMECPPRFIDVQHQEARSFGCPHRTLDVSRLGDPGPLGTIADPPEPPRPAARGGIQGSNEARGKLKGVGRGHRRRSIDSLPAPCDSRLSVSPLITSQGAGSGSAADATADD